MDKGILIIAYGDIGYARMAYNLALSIDYYSNGLPVAIVHDGVMNELSKERPQWQKLFQSITTFTPEEHGRNKVKLDKYTPFKHTIYIDADSIITKDINPLLDACIKTGKPLLTQVQGKGGLSDAISYGIWAKNTAAWAWFDIPMDATFQATQTSMVYFSDKAKPIFGRMREYFNFPIKHIRHKWGRGNNIPDELIYSGVCAALEMDIDIEVAAGTNRPIFFGNAQHNRENATSITDKYYVLSFCGSSRSLNRKYLACYNVIVGEMQSAYTANKLFNSKFVG